MLGEDTLLFTRDGFKTLKELNIYDEVLTPFGEFEPIVKMSPWQEVDRVMHLNTEEDIYCSDNLLCNAGYDAVFTYIDDIETTTPFKDIFAFEGDGKYHPVYDAYEFAVVVPTCVPDAYILSDISIRLSFLAGLIDSPICEVGEKDGIYYFYTTYDDLRNGIVTLARSLGFGVKVSVSEGVYAIRVGISDFVEHIPIKDSLKKCYAPVEIVRRTAVKNVGYTDKVIYGREIKVNGGLFLVGYSLIPVQ